MQINKNFMAFGPLNVSEVGVAHGQWAGVCSACVRASQQSTVKGGGRAVTSRGVACL